MAITKQEVILEVKADTTEVTKSIDNVSTSVEGVSEATSGLTGTLDKMSGGAISAFSGIVSGTKKAILGLKSFKIALASTGIGLVVVALGSLLTAFNSSEEGANKLSKILTVVGSVTDNLLDLVADLGEKIITAFENPKQAFEDFKEALKTNITNRLVGLIEFLPKISEAISLAFQRKFGEAAQVAGDAVAKVTLGVEDFSKKAGEAAQKSAEFAKQLIDEGKIAATIADQRAKANKLERELLVERAELESEIAGLRLKSRQEDEFSAEVRKQALLDAQALEDQLLAKETEVLTLRRDAQIEENKLARSSVENLDKEAEAIAAVSRQEAARLNQQRSTQRELNRLNKEIERDAKAAQKAEEDKAAAVAKAAADELAAQQKLEDELYALTLTAQEREELALLQAYDKRIAIAGDNEGLIKAATEQFLADQDALQEKYANNETQRQQALARSRVQLGLGALSALQQLNTAFQKDDEASAKRAFKRQKALGIATATIQTAQAVTAALTAGGNPVKLATGAQFVEAGIALSTGIAQIATISKQKFQSTTTPDTSSLNTAASNISVPAVGSSAVGAGTSVGAPQLDLGFLGQGQTDVGPIQAYVISQDVTTAQQANQQIAEQAAL